MRIPKSFKLFGRTVVVKFDEQLAYRERNAGEADFNLETITLQPDVPGAPRTDEQIGATFCHELVHHILSAMNDDLAQDETFVDLFGSLLHQALTTAQFGGKK